jgi:hypothetical protein
MLNCLDSTHNLHAFTFLNHSMQVLNLFFELFVFLLFKFTLLFIFFELHRSYFNLDSLLNCEHWLFLDFTWKKPRTICFSFFKLRNISVLRSKLSLQLCQFFLQFLLFFITLCLKFFVGFKQLLLLLFELQFIFARFLALFLKPVALRSVLHL